MTAFVVTAGTTQTARITMAGSDTLTVQATGSLSVSANAQAVRFTASANGAQIDNSGTIEDTAAGGRAIRLENTISPTVNLTINNIGTGSIISSPDDAIQIQAETDNSASVTAGLLTLGNAGLIASTGGQALDFAATGGTFVMNITNSGTIRADVEDAVRIGSPSVTNSITNTGTIRGGNAAGYSGADGVQFEDNAKGTVTNNTGGAIAGDRHGVNAGVGSIIAVTNNLGATITGNNGSGVGSDGTATVTNYGTITGAFDPNASDINGPGGAVPDGTPDGDGDGIDIDGQATIENFGLIEGTGANGHGSDGLPNTSEGIAAGGGTFTNHTGATIRGLGLGMLIDNSSQGNAPFQTTITNDGTIQGTNSTGIKIVSTFADVIVNNGTISGGAGTAILFGAGNNTLRIGASSVITGVADGEGGTNTLDYVNFGAGPVTVDLGAGTATGTSGIVRFQNVTGGAGNDTLTGDANANVLSGAAGDDTINYTVGGGADTIDGGTNTATGDTLAITGTSGSDTLGVVVAGGVVTGVAGGSVANVEHVTLNLFGNAGASDTLDYTGTAQAVTVNLTTSSATGFDSIAGVENVTGGSGNDILTGGPANGFANTLIGGAGDDTFNYTAGGGNDTIDGGTNTAAGDTLAIIGSAGNDGAAVTVVGGVITVLGTGGSVTNVEHVTLDLLGGISDILSYFNTTQAVTVNLATSSATGFDSIAGVEVVNGGLGNDTITGDANTNGLNGGGGDDTINYTVGDGADAIDGGSNTAVGDTLAITGTAGNDTLAVVMAGGVVTFVAFGTVVGIEHVTLNLLGGTSDTLSYTTTQAVTANLTTPSATGFDSIAGVENVTGGSGNDTLTGNTAANTLNGAGGNDAIEGGLGADTMDGGTGINTLSYLNSSAGVYINLGNGEAGGGDAQGDNIAPSGTVNFQNLIGSAFNDVLFGDGRDNVIEGRGGADALHGGGGINTLSYASSSAGVYINLGNGATGGGDAQGDNFAPSGVVLFQNLLGSAANDVLFGDGLDNVIEGRGGADTLYGGSGTNTLSYASSSAGVYINLGNGATGGGDAQGDNLAPSGGVLFQNIIGSAANDVLFGDGVNNVIEGGAGADTMLGGGGFNTLSYASSSAGVYINLGNGATGGGDAQGDNFAAGGTVEFQSVIGSAFNDVLFGDGLANVIDGRAGADTLLGGSNDDTFQFRAGQASGDTVIDFAGNGAAAGDAFAFFGFGTAGQGATFTQVGASTQWQIHSGLDGHNEIITLSNGATAHQSDFLFV